MQYGFENIIDVPTQKNISGLIKFNDIEQAMQLKTLKNFEGQVTNYESKPTGIADRVFIDIVGFIAIYFLFFLGCDITRNVITGQGFFNLYYIFWGPYYYITKAPLMTRYWKSKKFLKDLSELENEQIDWPLSETCQAVGATYEGNCDAYGGDTRGPIRKNLGAGLDWILRHTIGTHFGGLLSAGSCTDQGNVITAQCADDRLQAIWDCYNFVVDTYTDMYDLQRAGDIDWPNKYSSYAPSFNAGVFYSWNDHSRNAYAAYQQAYCALYDIGSATWQGSGRPDNLMPNYDSTYYYSYFAEGLFGDVVWHGFIQTAIFDQPPWYRSNAWQYATGSELRARYFQTHYKEHLLDYWDY